MVVPATDNGEEYAAYERSLANEFEDNLTVPDPATALDEDEEDNTI